jgi:O-acetyl-ADP-ribose deacetylase (regulator of RNase III)
MAAGEDMTEKNVNGKTIRLMKGDVTDLEVDAFAFYASEDLALGSGYGTAVAVRGGPKIQEELNGSGPLPVGEAVVTGAGEMKARYIIHAVGPKFREADEEPKLRKTMLSALRCAEEKGAKRIAFPAMGTGFYGVPVDLCARVMLSTIRERLNGPTTIEEVIVCVRDTREIGPFSTQLKNL